MSDALDDSINGLLQLAREAVRRNQQFVKRIDGWFRLFTPREIVSETLLGSKPLPKLSVSMDEAARAHAWESWLFHEIEPPGVLR